MSMKKHIKNYWPAVVILIVIILIIFNIGRNSNQIPQNTYSTTFPDNSTSTTSLDSTQEFGVVTAIKQPTVPNPFNYPNQTIQNILNKAQDYFAHNKLFNGGIYHDTNYFEWKNKDDWYINTGSTSPTVTSFTLCKNGSDSQFKTTYIPVYSSLEKIFLDNGFIKNDRNSIGEYKEDDSYNMGYSYDKAFEKGNVQCLIHGLPVCEGLPGGYGESSGSPIGVTCTDKLSENASWQLPILKALNLKNDSIYDMHDLGDFIILNVRYEMMIVEKESSGSYKIIYKGQDSPLGCDVQDYYNFPTELRKSFGEPCRK